MAVAGLVLAAGESRRMQRPKALLPWGDTPTLLEHQVAQLRAAGCEPVIVVWGADPEVERQVRSLGVITVENEAWHEGRASSTRAGAAAVPDDSEAVVVVSVDQPAPAGVVARLLENVAGDAGSICVPAYGGKRGHPVALPGRFLAELREVDEESLGLHALIEAHPPVVVEVDEPLVVADINTRDDYERLHEQVFGRKPPAG